MFRKHLLALLMARDWSLRELSAATGTPMRRLEEDLAHLARSLKRQGLGLRLTPARCRTCGFRFSRGSLHRPSRCPRCRGQWLADPRFRVRVAGGRSGRKA